MFTKCLILLSVFVYVDSQYSSNACEYPSLAHGRVRTRQRGKLIKYSCLYGYELVGNKYSTCRFGEWDVPTPVCVKPGCKAPPLVENGVQSASHAGAWIVFFCLPGYKRVGDSTIYCDGRKWNGTTPTCADTKIPSELSCDFEDPRMCGWSHDDLHDFDWKRLNRKTPSSFLFTGPSFDHTFGVGGSGYYMYIESTSRLENDTARLLSPIYASSLAKDGCFSFFYHMFGKTTGTLRVYQKPDRLDLQTMLQYKHPDMDKYLLFEKKGNQGDTWYRNVSQLRDFSDSFQIVIEGIRGSSFTSDIAIDDVAILQSDNCTAAMKESITPPLVLLDSCNGRCDVFGSAALELGCGCTASCVADSNCCADFFDACVFEMTSETDENSQTPVEQPQTEKLVASTARTIKTNSTTTKTTPPDRKSSVIYRPTTTSTTISTTVKLSSAPPKTTTTTVRPTKRPLTLSTTKTTTKTTTKSRPTTTKPVTMTRPMPINVTTARTTQKRYETSAKVDSETTSRRTTITNKPKLMETTGKSHTWIIVMAVILCSLGLVWLAVTMRSARGRLVIARLRGETQQDPEVRYLNSDFDE